MIGIIALYTFLMSLSVLFLDNQGYITLPEPVTNKINALIEESPKVLDEIKDYVSNLALPTQFEISHAVVELNDTIAEKSTDLISEVYIYFKDENTYMQMLKMYTSKAILFASPYYKRGVEVISVYYNYFKKFTTPYYNVTANFVSPYYSELSDAITPYLYLTKDAFSTCFSKLCDTLHPYYNKAIEFTEPSVSATKVYTSEYLNSAVSKTSDFYDYYLAWYVEYFLNSPVMEDLTKHKDLANLILLITVFVFVFPRLITKSYSFIKYVLRGFVKDTHALSEGISAQYKNQVTDDDLERFTTNYGEPVNEEMFNGESGSLNDGLSELEDGSNRAKNQSISKGSNRTKQNTRQELSGSNRTKKNTKEEFSGSNRNIINYQEETNSKKTSDDSIQSKFITNIDSKSYPEFEVQQKQEKIQKKSLRDEDLKLIGVNYKGEDPISEFINDSLITINDVETFSKLESDSDINELDSVLREDRSIPYVALSKEMIDDSGLSEVEEGATISLSSENNGNGSKKREQDSDSPRTPSESELKESLEASLKKLLKADMVELNSVENDLENFLEEPLLSEKHDLESKSIISYTGESSLLQRPRSPLSTISTGLLPLNLELSNKSTPTASSITVTVKTHTASSSSASIKKLTEISASASRPTYSKKSKKSTKKDPNPLYDGNTADLFSDEEL